MISLGMSSDAISHFIASVLEHTNALFRKTMSFLCFNVSFSDPFPWIVKECGPTLIVNIISEFEFCTFFLNFSGRSMHARLAFIPIMQSPFIVK